MVVNNFSPIMPQLSLPLCFELICIQTYIAAIELSDFFHQISTSFPFWMYWNQADCSSQAKRYILFVYEIVWYTKTDIGHWHCHCSVKTRYLGVMGNARMTESGQKSVKLLNNIVNYVKFFIQYCLYHKQFKDYFSLM